MDVRVPPITISRSGPIRSRLSPVLRLFVMEMPLIFKPHLQDSTINGRPAQPHRVFNHPLPEHTQLPLLIRTDVQELLLSKSPSTRIQHLLLQVTSPYVTEQQVCWTPATQRDSLIAGRMAPSHQRSSRRVPGSTP